MAAEAAKELVFPKTTPSGGQIAMTISLYTDSLYNERLLMDQVCGSLM